MSRTRRQESSSGYYHVVMRGVGRQLLFEGDAEMESFLDILCHYRDKYGFDVIAWCLMGNHVHLLVRTDFEVLSVAMKCVALTFAQEHNRNAGHVGHVFQDRFKSKPIETDEQLLACVRYIHNNPVEAGICPAGEYRWSSFAEYAGTRPQGRRVSDTSLVLDMLGGTAGFLNYADADALAYNPPKDRVRLTDAEARAVMNKAFGGDFCAALGDMSRGERDDALARFKAAGLSARQIERLTGIGRNIVQRA